MLSLPTVFTLALASSAASARMHRSPTPLSPRSGTTTLNIDFSTYSTGTAADFLSSNGLAISDYSVASTPDAHTFLPANVAVVNGALELTVSGGTTNSAEVSSTFDVLYGSITTRAKVSPVAGTCSSSFFYNSDNAEIDIEILTSYITTGYNDDQVPPGIEFTNQPLVAGDASTNEAVAYGFDPTADFHDYTVVWTSGSTEFYIDGVLKTTFTTNVPQVAGPWVWNNWSSGDPLWSAGPPTSDNVFQIQSITGYYTS